MRTRAAGGPTTEDIYTGLLTGARQVQVVSNSGVFTVEFDPDLRGGRRYTDKAARMVAALRRAARGDRGRQALRERRRHGSTQRARTKAYDSVGWDPQQGAKRYDDLLKKERLQATVNDEDEDAVYAAAIAGGPRQQARASQRAAGRRFLPSSGSQMRGRGQADQGGEPSRSRQLELDGKGYATR